MRLIDADALIEKCGEWYVEEGTEEGFIGTIKQLIDTQPTIQPEQQWIPVEERLPEPWTLVLVTDSCRNVSVCQMALDPSDGWYNECENWTYFSTSVIAWMPLPEYYQGKDGEQE